MSQQPLEITEAEAGSAETSLVDIALVLAEHIRLLTLGPLACGVLALGVTYLITPSFTATTTFIPPQQQQSAAASALASLGALSGLVGAAGVIKSPGEQYVSLLQSVSVSDRLIDQFKLMEVYDVEYRFEARKELASNVQIELGKKDGLIMIRVSDTDPKRAAELANQHVAELLRVTSELALTEAQQRRKFFEEQLKQTRDKLASAQTNLESGGFNAGALRAEPRAAADAYARLKAEVTAAEVRLQTVRRGLADMTPEVQQQQTLLMALRSQLAKLEAAADAPAEGGYVGRYREFKYQETLFELFSRQYELARLDESREGALIQVIDPALPPERKSYPKRALAAAATLFVSFFVLAFFVFARYNWRRTAAALENTEKLSRLRAALGLR